MKAQEKRESTRRASIAEYATNWPGIFAGAVERVEKRARAVLASSSSVPALQSPGPENDDLYAKIAAAEREAASLRLANGTLRRQLKEIKARPPQRQPTASSAALHQVLHEAERSAAIGAAAARGRGGTHAPPKERAWSTEEWVASLGLNRLIAEQVTAKLRSRTSDVRHERPFIAAIGGLSREVTFGLIHDTTLSELLADALVDGAGDVAVLEAQQEGRAPPPRHPTHRFASAERLHIT
jgi:hypothetical protein